MSQGQFKTIKVQIFFDEADGEGIVFFGNYFRIAHRAFEQYISLIGISWQEWFKHPELGVPLRHVEADYLSPLRPGDLIEIDIRVAEVTESSVRFTYDFRDLQGRPTSRLATTHVFADRKTFKKMAIPDDFRKRLEAAR